MPNTTLLPGQMHTFTDTEGGSDLVIYNHANGEGQYTIAFDQEPAEPHQIAPDHHDLYEVAYRQSATVNNIGTVDLEIAFADE